MADNFESADHALTTGMVLGLAAKNGFKLEPVMDAKGNYTDRFEVAPGENQFGENVRVFIKVEPPQTRTVSTVR